MKTETAPVSSVVFVGLKSKMYSYIKGRYGGKQKDKRN